MCQRLIQEGQDLYVTTTTPKNQGLQDEIDTAKRLTDRRSGSVTLLRPQYEEFEEPAPEWVSKLHKTYFGCLSELENIHTIIGTLPGTAKAAVEMASYLECKLVLLATTKIGTDQDELKTEIQKLSEQADEIWSVGLDLFEYFQDIFKDGDGALCAKHKKILLQPDRQKMHQMSISNTTNTGIRKVVSFWNQGHPRMYKGKPKTSKGSNLQNYWAFGGALAEINDEYVKRNESKIQWIVHGLKGQDQVIESLKSQTKGNTLGLVPQKKPNSLDDVKLQNCLAFLVPDITEETLKFVALSAMWQGVPTIVPSESSVEKFLLSLSDLGITCPAISRAVITLTGEIKVDKEKWITKLYKEVLNHDANPRQWAKELAEMLHQNKQLWHVDLTVFNATYKPAIQDDNVVAVNVCSNEESLDIVQTIPGVCFCRCSYPF